MTTPRKNIVSNFFLLFFLLKIEQFEAKWKTGEKSPISFAIICEFFPLTSLSQTLSFSYRVSHSLPLNWNWVFHVLTMALCTRVSRYDDNFFSFLIHFMWCWEGWKLDTCAEWNLLSLTLSCALESFYHSHLSQIIASLLIAQKVSRCVFCVSSSHHKGSRVNKGGKLFFKGFLDFWFRIF